MTQVGMPVWCGWDRRSILALVVMLTSLVGVTGYAKEGGEQKVNTIIGRGLDMTFIHGGGGGADTWALLDSRYVPGRYLVELSVNGADAGKHILDVTHQDTEGLCLTQSWLTKAGIYIEHDFFRDGYDTARQCWVLTNAPGARVDFDVSTQSLELSIPQKGLHKQSENVEWDYGTDAFRVNYSANANTGRYNTSVFGSADLKANVERWVVSSFATANGGSNGGHQATIEMVTASRSLQGWSADFEVGKTSTGDSLLGSTGTYGVTLSRNNSMKPGSLGYRPVFSGVATTPSRVTLTQSNRMLYSEMVPPGPFAITDVSLYSSGDVTMSVTGDDGQVSTQIFPLSVVSGQLSPGTHEFSVAAGMPDDDSKLEGGVFAASYGYGLDDMTLRAGTVLSQQWQGGSVGGVVGIGVLGAMSIDGMHVAAAYQDGTRNGNKVKLAWNKQLTRTGTGLRVSGSRQDKEYEELSSFEPGVSWHQKGDYRRLQDEWNVGVSQPVVGLFSLSLSGWQRNYYPRVSAPDGRDTGISGTLSTQIKKVSLNVGASASQGQHVVVN
ncbi:TPA: fimbria/pilus outer membrane usher protein [Aeromonas hydrophila]